MSQRTRALLFAALALGSCAAPRPPTLEHAVDTTWGTVRAARREDAVEMALVVERVAPKIAAAMPNRRDAVVDLRLVEELGRAHWGGATIMTESDRWIELPADRRDAAAQAILAHELVHYWLGAEWSTLPPVLEEGLAIHLAHGVVPDAAPRERAEFALVLGTLLHGSVTFTGPRVVRGDAGPRFAPGRARYTLSARIDVDDLPELRTVLDLDSNEIAGTAAPGVRAVLDAIAYVIVDRIGARMLQSLCEQARSLGFARVPSDWIWSAARIHPDEPVGLDGIVREMLREPEIRALLLREDLGLGSAVDSRP